MRLVGPVAVLVSRFPVVTETFILRELDELERQGVPVVLVPLRRESPRTVHAEAVPWIDRAEWCPLLDRGVLRDALAAVATAPRCAVLAVAAALEAAAHPNALAGAVLHAPKALALGVRLRRRGVVHLHAHFATHPAHAALLASAAGRTDLPWSITVHAHDLFVTQAGLRRKLRAAAFVRCISEYNRRFVQDLLGARGGGEERLPVIGCGIRPELYSRDPAPGRPGVDRPARVLAVAALKPYKGLAHLVDAVGLLARDGVDLVAEVIGEGPERSRLEARIASAGLRDRVRLLGARTQEQVAAAMRTCDAFVLPSVVAPDGQMEGLPVALMESLAAGVPTVATRLSGIPELVVDGETGFLVEPGDAPALAAALRRALAGGDGGTERARAGRRRVAARHDLREVVALLAAELEAHGASLTLPDEDARLVRDAAALAGAQAGSRVGVVEVRRGADAASARLVLPGRGDGPPVRAFAKLHLDRPGAGSPAIERAAREAAALRHLAGEGLPVPRLIAADPERGLVVMEESPGASGAPVLAAARRDAARLLDATRRAGEVLGRLAAAAGPPREAAAFDRAAVLSRMRAEARADAAECLERGLPRGPVRAALGVIERELTETLPTATCWTHGDYWPGNLLVGPEASVTVVDWEGLRPGFVLEDAATWMEHVALALPALPFTGHARVRARAARLMLEAGCAAAAEIPRAVACAKALRLASRAPGLVAGPRLRRNLLLLRFEARLRELT